MLIKLAWTHSPEARDKTIKQFMETVGMPTDDIELKSRYRNLDGTGGLQFYIAPIPQRYLIMHSTGMA